MSPTAYGLRSSVYSRVRDDPSTHSALRLRPLISRVRDERGVALLVALMSTTLLMTLGAGLVLLTITETTISSNHRDGIAAFYAADAAIERVLPDLAAAADWDAVLAGRATSTFVDGPAGGARALGDGTSLSLIDATHIVRCSRVAGCTATQMDAVTAERRWGRNNPRWQLYAYGRVRDLMPAGRLDSRVYVVVWVADDPFENDGDPLTDGSLPANPGGGVLVLRAHAYGPLGVRRVIEAIVSRAEHGLRLVSWQELR